MTVDCGPERMRLYQCCMTASNFSFGSTFIVIVSAVGDTNSMFSFPRRFGLTRECFRSLGGHAWPHWLRCWASDLQAVDPANRIAKYADDTYLLSGASKRQISPSFQNFSESWKLFPTFPKKVKCVSSTKISDELSLVISLYFRYFGNFFIPPTFWNSLPWFHKMYLFGIFTCFSFPPNLTMMHSCLTQCTYWTPLPRQIQYKWSWPKSRHGQ